MKPIASLLAAAAAVGAAAVAAAIVPPTAAAAAVCPSSAVASVAGNCIITRPEPRSANGRAMALKWVHPRCAGGGRRPHAAICWRNYQGKNVHYATVPPGGTFAVDTFVGHPWTAFMMDRASRACAGRVLTHALPVCTGRSTVTLPCGTGDSTVGCLSPAAPSAASTSAATPMTIRFTNRACRRQHAVVCWQRAPGRRVPYHSVPPGGTVTQQTFESHPWVVFAAPDGPSRRCAGTRLGAWTPICAAPPRILTGCAPPAAGGCLVPGGRSSRSSSTRLTLRFANRGCLATAVHVCWVNYQGKLVQYFAVDAGKARSVGTFETHPWMVFVAGGGEPCRGTLLAHNTCTCATDAIIRVGGVVLLQRYRPSWSLVLRVLPPRFSPARPASSLEWPPSGMPTAARLLRCLLNW